MSPKKMSALVLLILCLAPLHGQEEPDAATLFAQGRSALFQGKYQEAIEALEKAVALDPEASNSTYRVHLARAQLALGQTEEPEALLAAVIALFPEHVEAGQLLAGIYADQGRFSKVIAVLEPLLAFRHDYQTNHMLAEASYNQEKFDDARGYYLEAIRLHPGHPGDHAQLGNLYLSQGRFARAVGAYKQALQLGLQSPLLHYKLASAYFNLRNYFGKVRVVEVPSGEPETINGDWYLIERVPGKRDGFLAAGRSTAIFQAALAVDMGIEASPAIDLLIANIYLNARRHAQAYERYQALRASIPEADLALYHYYVAQSALGVGRYDEFVEALQEAGRLDPDAYGASLVEAYVVVAGRYEQAGDSTQRIRFLERAVQESPETASLHLRLASAYEQDKQYAQAITQWGMVLALEPDHPRRTELLQLIDRTREWAAATPD